MDIVKVLLITVLGVMIATATAQAGVAVTPERHILRLSPGQSQTVEYRVYNSGPQNLDIEIDPQDWSGIEITDIRGVYSWISLEPKEFEVEVNQSEPFKIEVTAPSGVDGEMLAMLFLCYKEREDSPLNIRTGIPLYLIIEGTERYSARIETIEVKYDPKAERRSLDIMVTAYNSGNIHIAPDLSVSIQDSEGKEIKNLSLKQPKIILRGRYHTYRFGWRNPILAEGDYKVVAGLSYEDKVKGIKESADFEVKAGTVRMKEGKRRET